MTESAGAMQPHVHRFTKRVLVPDRPHSEADARLCLNYSKGRRWIKAWKCEDCGYKQAYDLTHELPGGVRR